MVYWSRKLIVLIFIPIHLDAYMWIRLQPDKALYYRVFSAVPFSICGKSLWREVVADPWLFIRYQHVWSPRKEPLYIH